MSKGGGSSSRQTTTQTTEPPAYLRPYLEYGANQAQQLYGQGPQQYYPGQTVVPFAQQTEQALGLQEQRALGGSPVNQAAQTFATNTLSNAPTSQFGGASNPYLDATFSRAADQVQNRLSSAFAGSGRNIEAARNPASQELNDLASRIYGGAYESERDRMAADIQQQRQQQLGVLGMSPTLANQDYVDINALRGVGSEVEDLSGRLMSDAASRWDFSQNAPGLNLDQFLARIQGMPGSSSSLSTPIYRNRGAGALGGALAGSQIAGNLGYGGGWGQLLGALGGGLLGGFG